MAKFKVGDRVRITGHDCAGGKHGDVVTVSDVEQSGSDTRYEFSGGGFCYGSSNELELVTNGDNTVKQRRTFKLLKDSIVVKKGALYQEQCDDGTQPYELMENSVHLNPDGGQPLIENRSLVEEQPQWFVEVFKVTPEYMTQGELDQWEAFKLSQSKTKRVYKFKYRIDEVVPKAKQARKGWTPEQRKAQSERMKQRWANKAA